MGKYILSEKQKERKRLLSKLNYQKNREQIREKAKIRYDNSRDKKAEYYINNKEKISERKKNKEASKNKPKKEPKTVEQTRARIRIWQINNREKCAQATMRHRNKNRDRVNARNKELKSKRRDELNNLAKQKRIEDINFRLKCRGRALSYAACKKQGLKKQSSYTNTLGCTIEQFKNHIESLFTDGMNWGNMGDWHLDHIKPCASFDLSIPEEFKKCFHYSNQQPLWATDNLVKGSFYDGIKHYHKKA